MSDQNVEAMFNLGLTGWNVVFPPVGLKIVEVEINGGPNLQSLEHCQYASTIGELWRRAPLFRIKVPLVRSGARMVWDERKFYQYVEIELPIPVFESVRSTDFQFFKLVGYIKFLEDFDKTANENRVKISSYSVQSRKAKISMSNDLYLAIIGFWQKGFFKASSIV